MFALNCRTPIMRFLQVSNVAFVFLVSVDSNIEQVRKSGAFDAQERPNHAPIELKGCKMLEGTIKTYHGDRAFGFIRPDSGGTDIFFHLKSCSPGLTPEAGARVSFNLAPDQRSGKRQAVGVRVEEEAQQQVTH